MDLPNKLICYIVFYVFPKISFIQLLFIHTLSHYYMNIFSIYVYIGVNSSILNMYDTYMSGKVTSALLDNLFKIKYSLENSKWDGATITKGKIL